MKKTVSKLGLVTKTRDDAGDMPLATMQSIGRKENTYVEYAPYGYSSNAPINSFVSSHEFLNESNNLYGIAYSPLTRVKNLKTGEVSISNELTKSKVFFDNQGNVIIEVTKDKIVTVAEDMTVTVGSDLSISVEGETTITSEGDISVESNGNISATAQGNISSIAQGNITASAQGDIVAMAQGDITISSNGANVNIISAGDTSITATGGVDITATGDVDITAANANITAALTTVDGDLRVSGSITDDYNANAVTLKVLRDTYNIHTHEQVTGGSFPRHTLPPDQPVLAVFTLAVMSAILDADD